MHNHNNNYTDVVINEHAMILINRLTIIIALVLGLTSSVGLINRRELYPEKDIFMSFVPNDVLNLALSLPLLLICLWLIKKNKLAGLLCLPGVLFNILYMFITNIIGLSLNILFLSYAILITLCVYTIIYIIANINSQVVCRRFSGKIPEKSCAVILIFLGIFNLLYQSVNAVNAVVRQIAVSPLDYMLMVDDVALNAPALLIGGVLLWKRKALGYVVAPGLLFEYFLLAFGVLPVMAYQARAFAAPFGAADFITILMMVLICLIPLMLIIRHAGSFTRSIESQSG